MFSVDIWNKPYLEVGTVLCFQAVTNSKLIFYTGKSYLKKKTKSAVNPDIKKYTHKDE